VLSNIYTYERLEDEVNYLTAVSEQETQKRKNIRYMDVFRSVEIRNAFFVGAGLQVIKTRLNFTVSKFYFLVLIPLYFRRLIGLF
jgi:SP family myo-inositol transporter-like MFS transporter 13